MPLSKMMYWQRQRHWVTQVGFSGRRCLHLQSLPSALAAGRCCFGEEVPSSEPEGLLGLKQSKLPGDCAVCRVVGSSYCLGGCHHQLVYTLQPSLQAASHCMQAPSDARHRLQGWGSCNWGP